MKCGFRKAERGARARKRGSAVIVVLVLALVMGMLISDNGRVLHHLKQEIQLIEKKQQRRHDARLRRLAGNTPAHRPEDTNRAGTKSSGSE